MRNINQCIQNLQVKKTYSYAYVKSSGFWHLSDRCSVFITWLEVDETSLPGG